MQKVLVSAAFVLLALTGGLYIYQYQSVTENQAAQIANLSRELSAVSQDLQKTRELASSENNSLRQSLNNVSAENKNLSRNLAQTRAQASPVVKTMDQAVTQVISKSLPAVVAINVYKRTDGDIEKVGSGSGFFISSDGYILTNKHVAPSLDYAYEAVLNNGQKKPLAIVYRDNYQDIAVGKIQGDGYAYLPLGKSAQLKQGQTVVAIGNALGRLRNSTSVGVVSGLNRTVDARNDSSVERLNGLIQTDAPVNPGNSGGPLLDLDGRVVGINVAMAVGSQSISFALPIDLVSDIARQYA